MSIPLSPLEATFLDWEDSAKADYKHFAWAMVFEPLSHGESPSLTGLRNRVLERLDLLPRFRERLSTPRVGRLTRPRWIPASNFNISQHVQQKALPAPQGERELSVWLANHMTERIDRRLPLWNLTLLPTLADGSWALVLKLHHCMIDGVGGAIAAVTLVMDEQLPTAADMKGESASERDSIKRLGGLRPALAGARTLVGMLLHRPDPPADTSLMVPLGPARHLAFIHVPLMQLRDIRSGLGGTINDVALTAVVGGLRALFTHRNETPLPDRIRIVVPMNMRAPSEARSMTMNVSFMNVAVPLAEEHLHTRYLKTVEQTAAMKRGRRPAGDQTLIDVAALVPPIVQRAFSRSIHVSGHFDIMVTNVTGPPDSLTFMNAPLYRVLPAAPPTIGHALNATLCSYSGTFSFGFNADRDAVPDLEVVRAGTHRTLEELAHMAK